MENQKLVKSYKETHRKKGTTITFTAEEIYTLGKYAAAGKLLLQTNHPVISRIKAAITRLNLKVPQGL